MLEFIFDFGWDFVGTKMLDEKVRLLIIFIVFIDDSFGLVIFFSEKTDDVGPQVDDPSVILELLLEFQTKVEGIAIWILFAIAERFFDKANWVGPDIKSICLFVFVFTSFSRKMVHQNPELTFDESFPFCEFFDIFSNDVDLDEIIKFIEELVVCEKVHPLVISFENVLNHFVSLFESPLHNQQSLLGDFLGTICVRSSWYNNFHHLVGISSILDILFSFLRSTNMNFMFFPIPLRVNLEKLLKHSVGGIVREHLTNFDDQ